METEYRPNKDKLAMNSPNPVYDGTITQSALDDPNNTHSILLNLIGNNCDVLEIGCATGYMTRVMVERQNCRVVGFEINEKAGILAKPYLQRLLQATWKIKPI